MDDLDAWSTSYIASLEGIIAENGWAIQGVLAEAGYPTPTPPFAYTVGLSGPRFGHPELVLIGLDPQTAAHILNHLGGRVRGGERLHAGQRIEGLLQGGYEMELLAVDDTADRRWQLGVANRLYGHGEPVDALQVVMPDHSHRFPWDPGLEAAGGCISGCRYRSAMRIGPSRCRGCPIRS